MPATHDARSFMCILSSSPSRQPRKVGVVIIYVFTFQRGRAGVSTQPAGPTSVWSLPSRVWHASKWQGEARGECFLKGESSSTGCRPAVIVELYQPLVPPFVLREASCCNAAPRQSLPTPTGSLPLCPLPSKPARPRFHGSRLLLLCWSWVVLGYSAKHILALPWPPKWLLKQLIREPGAAVGQLICC